MKKILLFSLALVCLSLVGCKKDEPKEEFKLTGTYWATESYVKGSITTWYYYRVWHFTSETEAEEIRYSTDTQRVNISKGDDPAKYGKIPSDNDKVIVHVTSLNYPKISTYETITYYYTQVTEETNYRDGEFITEEHFKLTYPKTGITDYFYKINR